MATSEDSSPKIYAISDQEEVLDNPNTIDQITGLYSELSKFKALHEHLILIIQVNPSTPHLHHHCHRTLTTKVIECMDLGCSDTLTRWILGLRMLILPYEAFVV